MTTPKIEILVGPIGSGKSTYARKRAGEGALVVCFDGLTEMLHAEYRYEQGLRECYRRMEEAIAREILRAGRDAVVDRPHHTRESRRRWIDFANGNGVGANVVAVVFPTEDAETHALRRYRDDPRGLSPGEWEEIVRRWLAEAEPVGPSEGFREIRRISHP
jgi:predicted kinase